MFEEGIADDDIARLMQRAAASITKDQGKRLQNVVQKALMEAMRQGDTDRDFLARLDDVYDSAGITVKNSAQVASTFETAMATAYNAGTMTELLTMTDTFPDWIYLTRDDNRVRPNHEAMHRFVAPANDKVWNVIYPPNGYRCRCIVDGLTAEESKSITGTKRVLPATAFPDPGFKGNPIDYLRRL